MQIMRCASARPTRWLRGTEASLLAGVAEYLLRPTLGGLCGATHFNVFLAGELLGHRDCGFRVATEYPVHLDGGPGPAHEFPGDAGG